MRKFFFSDNLNQFVEQQLLEQFKESESKFIIKIKESSSIEQFINMAEHDSKFEKFCLNNESLKDYWGGIWKSYGQKLSPKSLVLFHSQPGLNNFNLVRGAFYFEKALRIQQESKTANSFLVLKYLEKAIEYGSIHAMQQYHEYQYQQGITTEKDFSKIILNCKSIVQNYGSFSYLMLAEAFYHVSLWYYQHQNPLGYEKAYQAALDCCDTAQSLLPMSSLAIVNASIGQGLQMSNSLRLSTPREVRKFILDNPHGPTISQDSSVQLLK